MRHIGEKMILLLCIAVFGIAAVKLIDIGKEYYMGGTSDESYCFRIITWRL